MGGVRLQAVGTPRACYVCYKPTTTVLATANTVDFIYTCDTHLSDRGFATQLGEAGDGVAAGGAKKLGLSSEEIAKVKEQWEERQKRKQEKAKEKEKEKESKDGEAEAKEKDSKQEAKPAKASTPPAAAATPSPPPTATHQRYTLHRDIFAMRLADHRRRRQTSQAQALAPLLPSAPRSAPPPPTSSSQSS